MQGLLDTAEREFRVAGWNTPAAPVPDAAREPKNRPSAAIAPQTNRDANANARRRRSSKSVASLLDVPDTSPEGTPILQSASDASDSGDSRVAFPPDEACSGSNGDVSPVNGADAKPQAAAPVGKNYTGGMAEPRHLSRKRQRVQSGLDASVSRGTPSPPKRPGGEACPRPGELSAGSNNDDSGSSPLHKNSGTGQGK